MLRGVWGVPTDKFFKKVYKENTHSYFMTKQKRTTSTNAQITSALRGLWLRSRERAEALKQQSYTCQRCGAKKSVAKGRVVKVEVHHKDGIMWDEIIRLIREQLLVTPDKLEVLCKECHKKETYK